MVRYNTDGSLDNAFGTGGIAAIEADITHPNGAALLSTGQILVNDDAHIYVYSSTGVYQQTLPQTGFPDVIYYALTIQQSNGKIIAGGHTSNHYFVARWNSDLTLDTTFGSSNGYVTGPGIGASTAIVALVTDTSGTIYAVGYLSSNNSPCLYSSAGVSTTFTHHPDFIYYNAVMFDGNNNFVAASYQDIQFTSWASPTPATATPVYSDGTVAGRSQAILLQPTENNAIIIIGYDGANNLVVARFIGTGADYGNLDTTFGIGGVVTGIPMTPNAGAIQSDGKIIVGGNFNGGNFDGKVCVIRLNPDGTIDPTFQTPNFLGIAGTALTAALQSNGTFITAGTDGIQTCFASYNANGATNTAFGSGLFKSLSGIVTASLLQPNGYLVTASCCGQNCLARYTPTGILDTTFGGGNGFVTGPVGTFSPYALLLQPNGYLVALGTTLYETGNFCLVRYSSAGVVDTTFGGGLVIGNSGTACAGILQPSGQIVAAGNDGAGNLYITRYNTDGTPDGTFNNDTGSITGVAGAIYKALAQPNGNLVFVGNNGGPNFFLLRTNANGVIDTTFGTNGFATGPAGYAFTALMQSDGKIIALGTNTTPNGNLSLARFNTDGSLDTTFGSAETGVITGGLGTFYTALLQPNNQIVGIGQSGDTGVANFFISNYINPFTLASFTASYGGVGML